MDKARIAKSFSNAAQTYDQHAKLQRGVCDQLLGLFEVTNIQSVLDIGCGTGYGVKCLNDKFESEIHAVDLAQKMVEFAKINAPFASYQCADAESLPFQSEKFDLIISSLALQWLDNVDQVLQEISRCLKQNGQAWISTLGEKTLFELKKSWQSVDSQIHVNTFHNLNMWNEAALKNGLAIEVVEQSIELEYQTVLELAKDLKGIGAHNVNQSKNTGLTGKSKFKDMQNHYEKFRRDGKLPASYQIIYLKITKS